jgi:predicted nucleic acid-binding protein
LVTAHRFDIWDAVIVSASAEAGCRVLLSEDMQDGFVWRGMTIINPFAIVPHPMLASLLDEQGNQT